MANERLSLIIESQTRGTAEVTKLEAALNRVSDIADRSAKKTTDAVSQQTAALQRLSSTIKGAIQDPLGAAGQAAEKFSQSFGAVGVVSLGVVGGLTAAGGVLLGLVAKFGKSAEEVSNLADRLGVTSGQAEKLKAASKIAGVEIGALEGATKLLAVALEDTSGVGEKTSTALKKLGVQTFTATGEQREMGVVLLDVLARLSNVTSSSERAALAQQTLGRGSKEILPLIQHYKELNQRIESIGIGIDGNLTVKLAGADDRLDDLGLRWDLLLKKLAVNAGIPVLDRLEQLAVVIPGVSVGPRTLVTDAFVGAVGPTVSGITGLRRTPSPGDAPGLLFEAGLRARALGFASTFTAQQSRTDETAIKNRLEAAKKERETARQALSSGALNEVDRRRLNADFDRLGKEEEELNDKIALIEKARDLRRKFATFEVKEEDRPLRLLGPSLFRERATEGIESGFLPGHRSLPNLPTFEISEADRAPFIAAQAANQQGQNAAFGEGLNARRLATQQRDIAAARQVTDLQARRVELLAGPGGEIRAIEQATAIRLAGLEQQKTLGEDLFEIDKQRSEILNSREIQLLELQKSRLTALRDSAGQVFDALIAGGAGLRGFLSGFGLTAGRTVFQNIAQIGLGGATGKLSLPGTGTADTPTLLGRILSGTPFGPKITPLDRSASLLDKAAFDLSRAGLILSGGNAAGFALPGGGSFNPGQLFGGATSNPLIFNSAEGASGSRINFPALWRNVAPEGTTSTTTLSGIGGSGIGTFVPARSGLSPFAKGVGLAGIGLTTAFGVRAGVNQGGAQGALTAGASLAGGAAGAIALGLLGASAAAGPAAPILAAVALGLGLGASLLGNPKERRAREIDQEIRDRQNLIPVGIDATTDQFGSGLDVDRFGNLRRGAPILIVNQNFDMLDGRQVIDRRADFVDAMRQAVQDGGADPFVDDLRTRLSPA